MKPTHLNNEIVYKAIEALIELNNYIVSNDFDECGSLSESCFTVFDEAIPSYDFKFKLNKDEAYDMKPDDFFPCGFGSITDRIMHLLFREKADATIVLESAKEALEFYKEAYKDVKKSDASNYEGYISFSVIEYVKLEAEVELDIDNSNFRQFISHSGQDTQFEAYIEYYENTARWLKNVYSFINECKDK